MKIGLIARADNSGLGTLSWEFYRNLEIHRVVTIKNGIYKDFPERFGQMSSFTGEQFTYNTVGDFLKGLDLVLAIETPYDWNVFSMARVMGIKSVLISMFECSAKPLPVYPDLIACPSLLDYREFEKEPAKRVLISLPVARDRIKYKKRSFAKVFLHNVGHGGLAGRTGTSLLLQAIPLVKSNVRFIINSQVPLPLVKDNRVDVRIGNVKNYWDLWHEGDVFVFPVNQEMISMPVCEALAAGMPTLVTDFLPFHGWLPKHWLIPYEKEFMAKLYMRDMKMTSTSPEQLADKIDQMANKDITEASEEANRLAEEISWDTLKPTWEKLFNNLVYANPYEKSNL